MCSIPPYLSMLLLAINAVLSHSEHIRDRPQNLLNGSDLHRFVSRPDLMPPKFDIQVYDAAQLTPGYWFISPYADLLERAPSSLFVPGQVGPHIYDESGNLIWSGAHLFGDRSVFDFKRSSYNGRPAMTFIVGGNRRRKDLRQGAAVILDDSYRLTDTIRPGIADSQFNMHEFTLTENNTGLMITFRPKLAEVTYSFNDSMLGIQKDERNSSIMIGDNGFREFDLRTGETVFEWWASDHLDPSESLVERPVMDGLAGNGNIGRVWDFFHQNSVDKDKNGDYLISSRHLDAIFKISGANGSIIWQLGGKSSSFVLQNGFTFSSQHDARWRFQNSTHEIITFLDNAADNIVASSNFSSAMTIGLDLANKKATLLRKIDRPDHKLTRLRGNVQQIGNGNTFVCWSENGHISEFDAQGNLILDVSFKSRRFVTYRAYKFNFAARPSESIAIKTLVHGPSPEYSTTSIYVSWNGATEVASWRFYDAGVAGNGANLLGERAKIGFETVMMIAGTSCHNFAEAVSSNGTVLGASRLSQSVMPSSWDPAVCGYSSGSSSDEAGEEPEVEESSRSILAAKEMLEAASRSAEHVSVSIVTFAALCFCALVMLAALVVAACKIQKLKRLVDARSLPIAWDESEGLLQSHELDRFHELATW